MTRKYMRRCHYGALIAPIARIQSDKLVQTRLSELHRMFGSRKALVCTKIDVS